MICNSLKIFLLLGALNFTLCEETLWHIRYIQSILETGIKMSSNKTWDEAWEKNVQRVSEARPLDVEFHCEDSISRPVPTSVHTLHPADIAVVAALGDFVSAGRAMSVKSIFEIADRQNRGEAFSAGGDGTLTTGVLTLPNILKMFNPMIKGFAVGFGDQDSKFSGFNVATAYGTASTLLDQAEKLVSKLQSDTRIDMENDWKLVTVMIGHHDLCRYCLDEEHYSDAEFARHMTDTIDYLQRHLPRALISLVPAFDYSNIQTIFGDNPLCDTLQRLACPCAADEEKRAGMKSLQMQYYSRLSQLAFNGEYDNSHNFTVILQPHLVNLDLPASALKMEDKQAIFGPDCFHPGRHGQQALALMLWNTMMTPVGKKPLNYPIEETFQLQCPTWTRPYIFTNVNSGWAQLPPGSQPSQEPEKGELTSEERLEGVFILILVGVAGVLVGIIILGIILPIIRKKRKPEPEEPMSEEAMVLMKFPRIRELMEEEGATLHSSRPSLRSCNSAPSGGSLVRSGSTLSFDRENSGRSFNAFRAARSISQTSEDLSDTESKSPKFYVSSVGSLDRLDKTEKRRSASPVTQI